MNRRLARITEAYEAAAAAGDAVAGRGSARVAEPGTAAPGG
jgi:hypothetical protein